MRFYQFYLSLLCLLCSTAVLGQNVPVSELSTYRKAQALVAQNQLEPAIALIETYGQEHELDRDYLLYLARLYFWTGQMEVALARTESLLTLWPADYDVHKLHIDLYASQKLYTEAEEKIYEAINYFPTDADLQYRLAYTLFMQKEYKAAKTLTTELVSSDPDNKALEKLDAQLQSKLLKNFIHVEYRNYFLTQRSQRLDFQSYRYGRTIGKSTLVPQLTSGKAQSTRGVQGGAEFYTEITEKSYAYLQTVYSRSELFPDLRVNAAVYFNMKKRYESSLLISYLKVDNALTTIISPTLIKNIKGATLSGTANVVNQDSAIELTYRLSYRQFIRGDENYVGLAYGSLSRDEMIRGDENNLKANYISYETRWAVGKHIHIGLSYNRTITNKVKNRDQLHLYAKHDF